MKHVIRREEFSQNHLFTGHLHWVRLFSVLPRGLSFILSSALSWTSKRKILLALCLQITKKHKASPWVSAILASLVVWRGLCLVSLFSLLFSAAVYRDQSLKARPLCVLYIFHLPNLRSELLFHPLKKWDYLPKKWMKISCWAGHGKLCFTKP